MVLARQSFKYAMVLLGLDALLPSPIDVSFPYPNCMQFMSSLGALLKGVTLMGTGSTDLRLQAASRSGNGLSSLAGTLLEPRYNRMGKWIGWTFNSFRADPGEGDDLTSTTPNQKLEDTEEAR